MKVVFSLFLVIVFIIIISFFAKKIFNLNISSKKTIKVLDGVSLGSRDQLVLIQVGDEQVLIGVSPGNIKRIHKMEKNVDVFEGSSAPKNSFGNVLNNFKKK